MLFDYQGTGVSPSRPQESNALWEFQPRVFVPVAPPAPSCEVELFKPMMRQKELAVTPPSPVTSQHNLLQGWRQHSTNHQAGTEPLNTHEIFPHKGMACVTADWCFYQKSKARAHSGHLVHEAHTKFMQSNLSSCCSCVSYNHFFMTTRIINSTYTACLTSRLRLSESFLVRKTKPTTQISVFFWVFHGYFRIVRPHASSTANHIALCIIRPRMHNKLRPRRALIGRFPRWIRFIVSRGGYYGDRLKKKKTREMYKKKKILWGFVCKNHVNNDVIGALVLQSAVRWSEWLTIPDTVIFSPSITSILKWV